MSASVRLRTLRPAHARNVILPSMIAPSNTCFYDLPAELRIEIYRLALANTTVHILPTARVDHHPHPLLLTSRQIRNEVLPLIHANCRINAKVIDFDFTGLLHWMRRIPPDQLVQLCKNRTLVIELETTINETKGQSCNSLQNSAVLRRWLHIRADKYRAQPNWRYVGPQPDVKTAYEMRRRAQRMKVDAEAEELWKMLTAIGVPNWPGRAWGRLRISWSAG